MNYREVGLANSLSSSTNTSLTSPSYFLSLLPSEFPLKFGTEMMKKMVKKCLKQDWWWEVSFIGKAPNV